MATLASNQLGIIELANRTGDGSVLAIANALSRQDDWIMDAVWVEGTGATGHAVGRRTGLPSGSKRRFNDGVGKESSKTKQFIETYELLEAASYVDKKLHDINPNPTEFRRREDEAFLEGLAQTLASDFVYGNVDTDIDSMQGIAPRRPALGTNVINEGGSGNDVTSVWVIKWSPTGVYLTYPPGTNIGIQFEDMGVQLVDGQTAGTTFKALVSWFEVNVGLAVADERCLQRIANIESSGANGLDEDSIITAISNLPGGIAGASIIMNKQAKSQYDVLVKDKANVSFPMTDPFGTPVQNFQGVPIRVTEAITSVETALV